MYAIEDVAPKLDAALSRKFGGAEVAGLARLTGGATKLTYSFTAALDGARRKFILQLSPASKVADPIDGITPRISGDQDARIMIEAAKLGVKVPPVRYVMAPEDGLGAGYVTDFVEGETLGPRILRDDKFAVARGRLAAQSGEALAALHRIDKASLPFLKEQDALGQVRAYRGIVDHYRHRLPALALGLRWADDNAPRRALSTVVHGDFRTGNLIVGEDGLRAVLDWEVAQISDPMQDLGWLCVKTWRFGGPRPVGGFGAREDLFAAYEKASGTTVDPLQVRFWEAFGSVKWSIMCLRKGLRFTDGTEEISIEQSAIGRRVEEPLWDFLNLIEGRA
jgi:aminoglycoside phosphotransferase (APT) family kinase protein